MMMGGSTLRLGKVFGVEIRLDYSWFFIFFLITWSLAGHYFPTAHAGWSTGAYWAVGALTSVLFFGSVLAHELAHSTVAGALGIRVRDITLYIFGGAASMEREPKRARDDFMIAVVGPLTSLVLAAVFAVTWWLSTDRIDTLHAMTGWLAWINLALGVFNLLPGFPLDGGRAFRAAIWGATGDRQRATVIAGASGQLVATVLIFWGIWQIFTGNWASGIWIAFIGWFLRGAAIDSVQAQALEKLLAGHTVREVMMTDCPQVARTMTLDVVVDQLLLTSGHHCLPVVDDGHVVGVITAAAHHRNPAQAVGRNARRGGDGSGRRYAAGWS